ncbi:M96 mating-specific protein family [Phytophthora cinnamomi]|uniref:M96 mating-specific protein family n=1 Tax=Phytophthora cinnamomi TaxID=4785 RepID=UPI0035594363|nr:M96 mating-specific protein family [Phytophthora cinnamomi]
MSFLEHECSVSLAAALAFLDESLDAAEAPQPLPQTLSSPAAVLPSPSTVIPDPELLLEALEEDENTFAPPTQTALTNGTPSQLLVESNTLSVQETTIVPVASSKTQPKNSRKKKKLNYDPNKARNERRFELATAMNALQV